jgi:hypothetical protein
MTDHGKTGSASKRAVMADAPDSAREPRPTTLRRFGRGALALLFFVIHATFHAIHGRPYDILWNCKLSNAHGRRATRRTLPPCSDSAMCSPAASSSSPQRSPTSVASGTVLDAMDMKKPAIARACGLCWIPVDPCVAPRDSKTVTY